MKSIKINIIIMGQCEVVPSCSG